MKIQYHGKGPHGKTIPGPFKGSGFAVVVGGVVHVSTEVGRKLMADFGGDFTLLSDDGQLVADSIVEKRVDLKRLRWAEPSVRVGAVVTTFNGLEMTARLFDSFEPTPGVDLQVVVIDNCSTDGTREWSERNRIPFLQPAGRISVAEALNRGASDFGTFGSQMLDAEAGGYIPTPGSIDYLFVLNNDVVLPSGYLASLVEFAEDNPEAGWVVGVHRSRYQPGGEPTDIDGDHMSGDFSATLLRRAALEKVGPLDERFGPRYGDDEDMLTRLTLADFGCWRLEGVPYDGDQGGIYGTAGMMQSQQLTDYTNALRIYRDKWGDLPKSTKRAMGQLGEEFDGAKCEGYAGTPGEAMVTHAATVRRGKKAAIVQCGHIGDILLTLPIADELKRRDYHVTWYAVPPYDKIVKLSPSVDEIIRPAQTGEGGTPFEKAATPAHKHARENADVIIGAQIAPLRQDEYLAGPQPYVRFMYEATGFASLAGERPSYKMSSSLGLTWPRPWREFIEDATPSVLLNLRSESAPIRADWAYWSRFAERLAVAHIDVAYMKMRSHPWRGSNVVKVLPELPDIGFVPFVALATSMVVTPSTAPLWSAWLHDVPAVCLLPRRRIGLIPEGVLARKNSMQRNGMLRHWQAMDVMVDGDGAPELWEPEEFADLLLRNILGEEDLRALHAEAYGRVP